MQCIQLKKIAIALSYASIIHINKASTEALSELDFVKQKKTNSIH